MKKFNVDVDIVAEENFDKVADALSQNEQLFVDGDFVVTAKGQIIARLETEFDNEDWRNLCEIFGI